jgi:tryptophan-rich sensory protein
MTESYKWYKKLKKPSWAPPSWLFAPVWTVLYIIIAVSFGAVFFKASIHELPRLIVIPFVLNLAFNFLFTPIQFGLRDNVFVAIDIVLALATLVWCMTAIYSYMPWVALINIPYLLWVLFATVLQITITIKNW